MMFDRFDRFFHDVCNEIRLYMIAETRLIVFDGL
jgi:hypothetical protein